MAASAEQPSSPFLSTPQNHNAKEPHPIDIKTGNLNGCRFNIGQLQIK
jgi:hypothetical protein